MTERAAILLVMLAGGLLVAALYSLYRRRAGGPRRLSVSDFGLELTAGPGAFVVFTAPSCRPCKAALRVVGVAESDGLIDIRTVDATKRPELATRCAVRALPTVFLVTASGRVLRRWNRVPKEAEVKEALGPVHNSGA